MSKQLFSLLVRCSVCESRILEISNVAPPILIKKIDHLYKAAGSGKLRCESDKNHQNYRYKITDVGGREVQESHVRMLASRESEQEDTIST